MEHKLRVLVRLDIDRNAAVLAVNGCLTSDSYSALLPVIRRTSALINGLNVVIDLRNATHIDGAAAEALRESINADYLHHDVGIVRVQFPDVYPVCNLLAPMTGVSSIASSARQLATS